MEFAFQLQKHLTNDNFSIVEDLCDIIMDNNITNIEELKEYEDKIFTVNAKVLDENERIDYCKKILKSFLFDYELLNFEEIQLMKKMENDLEKSTDNMQQIKLLIKIFGLTKRDINFLTEAYNLIVTNQL